jgi:alkylation response protein AidB-like acyl-CoA dehydrogenase
MTMTYTAPVAEQAFVLDTISDIGGLTTLPDFAGIDQDLITTILEEGGKLTSGVFAPLNRVGDREGLEWSPEGVRHPEGFAEAYQTYVDGGWQALSGEPAFGGQGMPLCLAIAFGEQLASANMAFSLCMVLSSGAVEALSAYGSDELKALYLPKLISGQWTGTMNLTEPQAGSDVGMLRTMATPHEDGTWRIGGSKIFITWGEHQLADNIIHLVLARTPAAPAGTKGISLFVVPKFLPNEDGSPGLRNDLHCMSIEHKLGIHASPTCTMSFGDNGNCVGWLVGELNGGMRAMFAMMNHARLSVGLEGVSVAERAFQEALVYARQRVQSAPIGGGAPVRIVEHPDVRRMLMMMRALTQGVRAIAYCNAAAIDRGRHGDDDNARVAGRGLADLLTPITKAYATDIGVEVASIGIQIFGGMGFIEETGAAQHYRDIRIAPIYEGTNGIQALDLVGRKLHIEQGVHWRRLLGDMTSFCANAQEDARVAPVAKLLMVSVGLLDEATHHIIDRSAADAAAMATSYLRLFGVVVAAYLLARQAAIASARLDAGEGSEPFLRAKIGTAAFFADEILPEATARHSSIMNASAAKLFALSEEQLSA